jgi:hypothetical protein
MSRGESSRSWDRSSLLDDAGELGEQPITRVERAAGATASRCTRVPIMFTRSNSLDLDP